MVDFNSISRLVRWGFLYHLSLIIFIIFAAGLGAPASNSNSIIIFKNIKINSY